MVNHGGVPDLIVKDPPDLATRGRYTHAHTQINNMIKVSQEIKCVQDGAQFETRKKKVGCWGWVSFSAG